MKQVGWGAVQGQERDSTVQVLVERRRPPRSRWQFPFALRQFVAEAQLVLLLPEGSARDELVGQHEYARTPGWAGMQQVQQRGQ